MITDRASLTDEESRIIPVFGGGLEQCYQAQAGVDTDTMLVVSTHDKLAGIRLTIPERGTLRDRHVFAGHSNG